MRPKYVKIRQTPAWLWILLAALVLRVGAFLAVAPHPERLLHRDSPGYIRIASNLLAGNGYSQENEPPYPPDAFRTPVYPLFLSAIFHLWGQDLRVVATIQVLFSVLTIGLVYRLGLSLLSRQAAIAGGWLLTLSLGSVVYSLYILTETLFTLLVVISLLCLSLFAERQRKGWLAASGAACGLAILCRPVGVVLPLVWVSYLVWRQRSHMRAMLLSLAITGISTSLVVIPWILRNYQQFGVFTISTVSDYNLYAYNAVALEADLRGLSQEETRQSWNTVWRDHQSNFPDESLAGSLRFLRERSRQLILSHPLRYAYIHMKHDLNALLPSLSELLELLGITRGDEGTLSVLNQEGLVAAIRHYFGERIWLLWVFAPLVLMLGCVYFGALVGGVRLVRQRDWAALLLLVLPVFFLLAIPGPASHPRFRVPAMPMICMLAGVGWAGIALRVKIRREQL